MRGVTIVAAFVALATTALAIPAPMFVGVGPPVAPTVVIAAAVSITGGTTTYDAPATTAMPSYGPGNEASAVVVENAAPSVTDTTLLNPENVVTMVVTATDPWLMTFTITSTQNPVAKRTEEARAVSPVQDFEFGRASIGRPMGRDATCTAESGVLGEGCVEWWAGEEREVVKRVGWGNWAGWKGWAGESSAGGSWTGSKGSGFARSSHHHHNQSSTRAGGSAIRPDTSATVVPGTASGSASDGNEDMVQATTLTTIMTTVTAAGQTTSSSSSSSSDSTEASPTTQSSTTLSGTTTTTSDPSGSGTDPVPEQDLPSGPSAIPIVVTSAATSASDRSALLDLHNTLRTYWGVGNMTWDTNLETYATDWASRCVFNHTGGPYGENLAAGGGNPAAASLFALWKAEDMSASSAKTPILNHKTEIVWKSTSYVGCGVAQCPSMTQYETGGYTFLVPSDQAYTAASTNLVCNYYEPGNIENPGAFAANVLGCTAGEDACGPTG